MRGLHKASGYYNTLAARRAYLNACLLTQTEPAEGYESLGWCRLDKLREKLLAGTPYEGMNDEALRGAAEERAWSHNPTRAYLRYVEGRYKTTE